MGKNILTSPATDTVKVNVKAERHQLTGPEKEVLASIKEILDTKDIVYELREYQPTEQFDERKAITEHLESLTGKRNE